MSKYKQDPRRVAIDTPLGPDKLLMQSISGFEEMSRLFSYELELLAEDRSIKAADIVGKNVTVRVELPEGDFTYLNGFVQRFGFAGTGERLSTYRATMVPWMWFLTRTSDCRIFQEKTVPQIIEQIFKDLGFTDYDISGISGSHDPWEYCAQYRESDFNFVSRLMEEEGIFYFFKHEKGKHTLMLADSKSAYKTCKEQNVNFKYVTADTSGADKITSWSHQYEISTGKWAYTDYNFETPSTSLMSKTDSSVSMGGNSKYEHYDFPGQYEQKGQGDANVKLRIEEEEASHNVIHGTSVCRTFVPGHKFTVKEHHNPEEAGEYVITSVRHKVSVGGSFTGSSSDTGSYQNSFTCIPAKTVYRPARITRKPLVHGVQTAVVTGPGGEEIYTDKYGRIKIQFHWDREGKKDEKSSCWVRCAQASAGKKWGSMFIPRIGQEVVVTFLEGDPDRPLVTGEVYNGEQMPPYDLPEHKTKSGIKTNSSKGGDGFNEIRFEDKAGKEQLFMHAEKNFDLMVKKDYQEQIDGDVKHLVKGTEHSRVKGDRNEKVDGTLSVQSSNLQEKVSQAWAIESGQSIHIKAGMNLVIEAGMQLSLKVGGNFVDISVAGVAINGMPMVMVNSGGAAGSGMGASPTDPEDAKPMEQDTAKSGQKSC